MGCGSGIETWARHRVAYVGDLHGNLHAADTAFRIAVRQHAEVICQTGDLYMWWPGDGERLLVSLERLVERHGIPFLFIDGNHEGWPRLDERRRGRHGEIHTIGDGVAWADRGARWQWAGVRHAAFGGAVSIDADERDDGVNWWPEHEAPDRSDADRTLANGPVDVLVTHDAPIEVPLVSRWTHSTHRRDAQQVRRLISEVAAGTETRTVVHGHWHHRHDTTVDIDNRPVRVIGLAGDHDIRSGGVWVADLDELHTGERGGELRYAEALTAGNPTGP